MITNHVLYPTELSSLWRRRQESNPYLRVSPVLCHELHPQSFVCGTRNRRAARASRIRNPDTRRPEGARANKGRARRKKGRVESLQRFNRRLQTGECRRSFIPPAAGLTHVP